MALLPEKPRPAWVPSPFSIVVRDREETQGEDGTTTSDEVIRLVDLATGELVDTRDLEALQHWRVQLRSIEYALDEARRICDRLLIGEMDRRTRYTMHVKGGHKLSAPSEEPAYGWDGRGVYDELVKLVTEGVLAESVPTDVVEIVPVDYKVRQGPLKNAMKRKVVAERLLPFRYEKPKTNRSVKVT